MPMTITNRVARITAVGISQVQGYGSRRRSRCTGCPPPSVCLAGLLCPGEGPVRSRCLCRPRGVLGEPRRRVDVVGAVDGAVLQMDLEVQMATGHVALLADLADRFAGGDGLAAADGDGLHVGVPGGQ